MRVGNRGKGKGERGKGRNREKGKGEGGKERIGETGYFIQSYSYLKTLFIPTITGRIAELIH